MNLMHRLIVRHRAFSVAVILCVGFGVGGATLAARIVDGLFFRPPAGVAAASAIYRVHVDTRDRSQPTLDLGMVSSGTFRELEAALPPNFALAGYSLPALSAQEAVGTQDRGEAVTANYFSLLGVKLKVGRPFSATENESEVVVSDGFWRSVLGARPNVVGSTLKVRGRPMTIVGVTDGSFVGVGAMRVGFWVVGDVRSDSQSDSVEESAPWIYPLLRVADGTPLPSVVARLSAALEANAVRRPSDDRPRVTVAALKGAMANILDASPRIAQRASAIARLLVLVSAGLFVVCVGNLVCLFLARNAARSHEFAVRLAMGGTTFDVVTVVLRELLGLGCYGLVIAIALSHLAGVAVSLVPGAQIDTRLSVLSSAFATVLTLAIVAIVAVFAAYQARRTAPHEALKRGTQTSGRSPALSAFTAFQIAAAVSLCSAGVAAAIGAVRLARVDFGFDPSNLFAARVFATTISDGTALRQLRSLPGVESASLALVDYGSTITQSVTTGGDNTILATKYIAVDSLYFQTLRLRLLRGRLFTSAGYTNRSEVVVNETLASRLSPNRSAIGGCIRPERQAACMSIVGIVRDAKQAAIVEEPVPFYYAPLLAADSFPTRVLIARLSSNATVLRTANGVLRERAIPAAFRPFAAGADLEIQRAQTQALSLVVVAAISLMVAAIGAFGVMNYKVAQRTRELGIRSALGATSLTIVQTLGAPVLAMLGVGIVVSAPFTVLISSALADLFQTAAAPALVVFTIVSALIACVVAASAAPAIVRGTRVSPVILMRE